MAMKYVSAIFLISFIAIAVFGFMAADYSDHNRCIVAIAQGGALCHDSALDFVVFHLGALKSFSLAIFNFAFLAIAIAFLALSIFSAFHKNLTDISNRLIGNFSLFQKIRELLSSVEKIKFSHWLSLCEKRDPSLSLQ